MAHSARREDYQRLGLQFVRSLDGDPSVSATRSFASFGQRFAQDRDSLPQTDADRAFHLVAEAAEVVDYELPFAVGEKAKQLVARGKQLLDEALALDADCFDALRMRSSTEAATVSDRYEFLRAEEPRVLEVCRKRSEEAQFNAPERDALGADLAMRPHRRWLASMAEEALICGRNRLAAEHAEALLREDPHDLSDVRYTLALAYAKLEDEPAFEELAARYRQICPTRGADDAWMGICRIAFAHKRHNPTLARTHLSELLRAYPQGAVALIRQTDIPDGEFARLVVNPYSEDEMVVAVSEAIVLLQEGNDPTGKGVLGQWIAANVAKMRPRALEEARAIYAQLRAQAAANGEGPAPAGPEGGAR